MDPQAVELVRSRFGLESPAPGATVPTDKLVELARALKDELGFHYLVYVTGAHHAATEEKKKGETVIPATPERFSVVYRVRNLQKKTEYAFRCSIPPDGGVPSLAAVWAGADWQERECFDLVGVKFTGHPDLRRLMMPEDWDGHPLQRSYAIDTPHRPWR